jgi:hypothetical protein
MYAPSIMVMVVYSASYILAVAIRTRSSGARSQAPVTHHIVLTAVVLGPSRAVVSPTGTGRWKIPLELWFAVDGTRQAA